MRRERVVKQLPSDNGESIDVPRVDVATGSDGVLEGRANGQAWRLPSCHLLPLATLWATYPVCGRSAAEKPGLDYRLGLADTNGGSIVVDGFRARCR